MVSVNTDRKNLRSSRIPEIDCLRGFAAFAVLAFHFIYKGPAELWMDAGDFGFVAEVSRYGYLGVDLFFIVSGFVIALTAGEKSNLRGFAVSRASRLFPAIWICATVTALCHNFLPLPLRTGILDWAASMTLVPSWFGKMPVDGAYWSLRLEVHFYLLVGVLIYFKQIKNLTAFCVAWLALAFANYVFPIWKLDFLLCLAYASYFIAGILFYRRYAKVNQKFEGFLLFACVAVRLLYGLKISLKNPSESAVVSALLIVTFYGAFFLISQGVRAVRDSAMTRFMGDVTYPLYLIHQLIGFAIFNTIVNRYDIRSNNLQLILIVLMSIFLVALSYLIHRYFERPVAKAMRARLLK
jgi:peptidoglycan/LPS O-acetylase OafA/YrhL